ncbi:MAG: domain S-box/diguanylate cyclase protein, partial [Rhodoferax sp.]|nr:domain S-box/diguanylate cyclase protein [Rhodoferax sp.]
MEKAANRSNEASTIAALRALEVLDSGAEAEFDALARTASLICDAPISLISLIDVERQWFKANMGLPGVSETPRDIAFCSHAVLEDQLFEVPDAAADPRFADNPLVTGHPDIRFYAGMPLRLRGGERVGTLCVIDRKPRQLSDLQRQALGQLALAAASALEGRVALRQMHLTAQLHARASLVLEHSADAVIGVLSDGRIERWNATAERMFGYSAAEVIGQPMSLLVPSFERARDAMAGAPALQGSDVAYESVRQHQSGRLIDVSVSIVPEFDAAGDRIGTTKFVRDISARKEAQRQLAESASSLRLVTDHIPSMVAFWNRDLTCRFANPAYRASVGCEGQDLTGRRLDELLSPALFAEIQPYVDAVLRGEAQHFERSFTGADGTLRYALAAYVPHHVNGELAGFLAQISDVTALKQTEQALRAEVRERERANQALHETTSALQEAQRLGRIGSWHWNIATDTSTWSLELYRMAGLSPDRMPPNFAERARLYTRDSWARLSEAVDRAVRLREPYSIEVQLAGGDGQHRWMETRGEPLIGDDGEVYALRGTAQDITERKRAEVELRHSQDFLARTGALAGV